MRKLFLILLMVSIGCQKETVKPVKKGWEPNAYYNWKVSMFGAMPKETGKIVFLGDSMIDRCDFSELLENDDIVNRGIGGDCTEGLLNRLDEINTMVPSKVFIMIGVNDLSKGYTTKKTVDNFREIINTLNTPEIYIHSILPTNFNNRPNDSIERINAQLEKLCESSNVTFIDIYDLFYKDGLDKEYTHDDLHLNGKGYSLWSETIKDHLN